MSSWPFRFVHAADFHLEMPPFGVAEVPDHLRELFIESAYLAAERVFETALSEEAEFLILSGDVLDPRRTGPRAVLFLVEQFARLAEREVSVYWAGGRVDPPDLWPSAVRLPDNVCVFPQGRPEELIHQRDAAPLVRLMGASRGRRGTVRLSDFEPGPAGLFSVAVVHGRAEVEALKRRGIDYWALGGRHLRHTLFSSPQVAHYPGTPQGRKPDESGPHGCTLVQVQPQSPARTVLVPTDVMRWENVRIELEDSATREDLEGLLHARMQGLVEAGPGMDLLVSWTVAAGGGLAASLRRGPLAAQLLEMLRSEYGFGPPAAWSVSLSAEPAAVLPPEWYDQETIRGDFLRRVRDCQMDPAEPLGLEAYLAEKHRAGTLATAAEIPTTAARERVLRDAAMLGVDLLSGEEPEP